ncbi:hypothetical protein OZN62_05245 [Aurantiacibacter sp. MUD11]|uniref:hypothetical protein n=1 Tax=Aurantiacibacter sp. MUD11 TaxID=3003265 RepID=UPI0022AA5B32|nr:hypothetical protein [Aurantiacibacter sp. MUD11]WAT18975.1 hypothetical protein OZN62_05245 [Aurantiacibacter sp. MUD11]
MRASLVLFATLAMATLGLRLASGDQAPRPDLDRFQAELATHLQAAGYSTRPVRVGTLRAVEAQRSDCHLSAAAEVFHGAKTDAFFRLQPDGRGAFVHYGGFIEDYPRLEPLVGQYVHRYLTSFGIESPFTPVILVAAEPGCEVGTLDFGDLRMTFTR